MTTLTAAPMGKTPLKGEIAAPGDKSISHRSLMFGALAVGPTRITGLLEGEDVRATARAVAALGAGVERTGEGAWTVQGVGVGGLAEPESALDLGNSGTGARLLMGMVAGCPITATFIGDASLSRRPMSRVIEPLSRMGAVFHGREGGRLPITLTGPADVMPIDYRSPVASAQVKSAVLLAGLNAAGRTTVREPTASRDHTENMLRSFGAAVETRTEDGMNVVTVDGQPELAPQDIAVPGDPSSAAFAAVAALILPGSEVMIRNVGLNPLRAGLFEVLTAMGGEIEVLDRREAGGEPVGDLRVRGGALKGDVAPPANAAAMIDEYPILCVAAALAEGRTEMRGIKELRVKESDRIALMVNGLRAAGVEVEEHEDGMTVTGTGGRPPAGGCEIDASHDHRIAMSFLVLGLACAKPIAVTGAETIATSYPAFTDHFALLGADIQSR
ncbi:MAG: 3-phosphoshikimate 1-carboxyvinyltransferase [Rhizobiales bacterium NRL2]|jgi:3-phosphoshikimate 1-carboxyvinyltransferase|nr:MAG: 3-phosphoshikimate 1-carboxyvinyltransferase [Rhizobiales bacterium NRL2]